MTTKTVTINRDGTTTIVKETTDPTTAVATGPTIIHRTEGFDHVSFIAGLIVGMAILLLLQRLRHNRLHRSQKFERSRDDTGRMESEVAALARRTATLETIVTDPAQRTAREIDALR